MSSGPTRCQKCNNLLSKQDIIAVPSGKYCCMCACKVYRYVLAQVTNERDVYKKRWLELTRELLEDK